MTRARPTVVVTRPATRGRALAERLEARGARVLLAPAIRCVAVDPPPAPARERYDWVALSSPAAAELVPAGWLDLAPRLAAIGPGTAAALAARGHDDAVVAGRHDASGLAALVADGRHVLHPVSDRARPEFRAACDAAGIEVDEPVVYRTESLDVPAEVREALAAGEIDAVLFASPSAASSFYDALDPSACRAAPAVAIGPTTAARLRELGVGHLVVAKEASDAGLVDATFARPAQGRDLEE